MNIQSTIKYASTYALTIHILMLHITGYAQQKAAVGAQLVGVYNMFPSSYPPQVTLKDEALRISGDPWTANAIRLPVEIQIKFQNKNIENGIPQPYYIRIEQDLSGAKTCPGDTIAVKAEVYKKIPGDLSNALPDAIERTCISNAKFGLKKGDNISQFENVMLFLADQDSENTNALPFKFGIAAWTATAGIWKNTFIDYSLADSVHNAPQIPFKRKPTIFRGKTRDLGLFVLQGQPGWGAGQIPRPYHMHIVHLFNNTQYPLLIRRTVPGILSKYNFDYTVPPRTAMPFAYIWLPKVTQAQLDSQASAPVRFYILKKAKSGSLPPGFNEASDPSGEETGSGINDDDIDARIEQIQNNLSKSADRISGYNDKIAELKRDSMTEIWAKGQFMYKICAILADVTQPTSAQKIVVIKRDLSSGQENTIKTLENAALYKGLRTGCDLRLIIDETDTATATQTELVKFNLDNYSDNNVFEKYLK